MRFAIAALGLMISLLEPASAQTVIGHGPQVDRGMRIRISDLTADRKREAVLVEWRGDSALARIDASGEYVVVPPQLVSQVEVFDGTRTRARKGALIGWGAGLAMGLLIALVASADEYSAPDAREAATFVVVNTATYAGIGALIGSFVKVPRWRSVGSAPKVEAVADPRGRLGVAFTVAF